MINTIRWIVSTPRYIEILKRYPDSVIMTSSSATVDPPSNYLDSSNSNSSFLKHWQRMKSSWPQHKYNTTSHVHPTSTSTVSENSPETSPDAIVFDTPHKLSPLLHRSVLSSLHSDGRSPVAGMRDSSTMHCRVVWRPGRVLGIAGIR